MCRLALATLVALTLSWPTPGRATAEEQETYDPSGVYLKGAFVTTASAAAEWSAFMFGPDLDTTWNYGFQALGGYRWISWLGTDVEVMYATGGTIKALDFLKGDTSTLSLSANARIYPVEWFRQPGKRTIEWSIALGIGGGGFYGETIRLADSSFLIRGGTGFDWLITDHWGLYVDGGYFWTTDSNVSGFGFAGVGGSYRF